MAENYSQYEKKWQNGHLYSLDKLKHGDNALAAALTMYTGTVNSNKQGRQWARTLTWVENILFGSAGRHYIDEVLATRISRDSSGNLSLNESMRRRIPQPTNDITGRFIETNISILTENRPVPRISPKSDSLEDRHEAQLSEFVIEYLWEELDFAEKHREIARLMLYCGIAFLEVWYDPLAVRHMLVPNQEQQASTPIGPGVTAPVPRDVMQIDPKTGAIVYGQTENFGDIMASVVSPFEMYVPTDHEWNRGDVDSGWIMKEYYTPVDSFKQRYQQSGVRSIVTQDNGYFPKNIEKIQRVNVQNYPLWWWERLADIVEGPHNVPFMGSPDTYEDYTVVRVFDRKPNPDWPLGRTVITAGDQLVYDSPKKRGARVFDKRWPHRWHPYVRYRGEAMVGSIYGRALMTKLLPCIKRINSIDATTIMYRRTVPIAQWIMPKGSSPVEGLHCLPAGALISTDRGAKKIREIQVGDRVLSKGAYATVTAVHENGTRDEFVHLTAYKHSDVVITSNHIVPIHRDGVELEVPAGEVRKGDFLIRECTRPRTEPVVVDLVDVLGVEEIRSREGTRVRRYDSHQKGMACSLPISARITLDDDLLWAVGLYAAEGCTARGNVHYCLGFHELDLQDRLLAVIEKRFGLIGRVQERQERGSRIVVFSNVIFQRLMSFLVPGTARTKYLRPQVFFARASLLPLVAGWMDGDGSRGVYHGCINFGGTTASSSLALQMEQIALDEGLLTSLYRSERLGHKYWLVNFAQDCHAMTVHSTRFAGKVGPKGRQSSDAIFEGGRWLFKVTREPKTTRHETQAVYDLTTDLGYYNAQGFRIHNSGEPGAIVTYDPNRTARMEPKPVFPPSYPSELLQERQMMLQEMEEIAGTELVLKGERPSGVTSAAMLGLLRNQALASRSPTLQAWDESLQMTASALLQETKKYIGEDEAYRRRIMILARDKASQFSIDKFAGSMVSDNVNVKIDTVSQALFSREAKQERALEVIQYANAFVNLPAPLQAKLLEDLGWPDVLSPKGEDVSRARMLIQFVKNRRFDIAVPMPEDDPYTLHDMLVAEQKSESFLNYPIDVAMKFFELIMHYRDAIQRAEQARMQMMLAAQLPQTGPGG